jgi:hypothetical protein
MRRRFCVLVLACLGTGWLAAGPASAAPTPPTQDPFYVPPPSLASYRPGAVIRSREVMPLGLTDTASGTAYELLYRTTGATGQPTATVTTLLLPALPASGQRKLVSYQTAEDSLTTNCAPSYTIRGGNNGGSTQWAESGEIATRAGTSRSRTTKVRSPSTASARSPGTRPWTGSAQSSRSRPLRSRARGRRSG